MIFDTRPDLYLWLHAIHILSKVGSLQDARWCKFIQTNPQDMWMCVCVVSCESVVWSVMHVLVVTFVLEGDFSFLALFMSSVHEALRLNCLPALPGQRAQIPAEGDSARLTIQFVLITSCTLYKQHHFLFVFSRLPSRVLCFVGLLVFWCVVYFRTPDNRKSMYLALNT